MLLSGGRGCSAAHQVGRVAPRPQNRGDDWTLLGRKPLPKKQSGGNLIGSNGTVAHRRFGGRGATHPTWLGFSDLADDDEIRIFKTEI